MNIHRYLRPALATAVACVIGAASAYAQSGSDRIIDKRLSSAN